VSTPSKHRTLWVIAGFKILKGLALLALAVGALRLLHRDLAHEIARWINLFRVDPAHRYVQMLLEKLGVVNDRRLWEFSAGTFFFSALYLTEGVGLALNKKWAEYLTVVSTAALIPVEIYEIVEKASVAKVFLLLVNMAVVVYLVYDIRSRSRSSSSS
jgi:uncharacterized membrane protein (DUF2068 family)